MVAGLAAAAVIAGGIWLTQRTPEPPNLLANATFRKLTNFPGDETQGQISPDGKSVLFASDRERPPGLWLTEVESGRLVNITKGLTGYDPNVRYGWGGGFNGDLSRAWIPGPPPPANRMRLVPLAGGLPEPFLFDNTVAVDWSPDGRRIVYFNNPRDVGDPLFVADGDGANPKQIFVERAGVHNHIPTWSAEGRWIYFVHGDVASLTMDLWRIAPTGGTPEPMTQHNGYVVFPAPLDEQTVLYIAEDADGSGPWLWVLDVETKTTRRVPTTGLERYTAISVAAPRDGEPRRLVATVANPVATLWSVPILDSVAGESDVKAFDVSVARALTPRFGGGALFFLSSLAGDDALWIWKDGQATEVWRNQAGAFREAPAIDPEGKFAALLVKQEGKRTLWVVGSDGSQPHQVDDTLNIAGSVSWSPDGKWIAAGGNDGGGAGLFKVPLGGGAPVRLTSGDARNPVWSPDNSLIVYHGTNAGGGEPLQAVTPDGNLVELPPLRVSAGGERVRFLPDGKGFVYMESGGSFRGQNFVLFDLATKTSRRLTNLNGETTMRTFDVSPDGKQIIFDRLRDNSDIVLIELPAR
jgi:Tol biopolymer transport system component